MCGIGGIVDLAGQRTIDTPALARMSVAAIHRGPDELGSVVRPGVGMVSRRLAIVDVLGSQQPVSNEDGSVVAVFNGELFDFVDERRRLLASGHQFRTAGDAEVLVHLWEELREKCSCGSAVSLRSRHGHDEREHLMILARDRVGICPLHWAVRDDRLYFASEIKGLLASDALA